MRSNSSLPLLKQSNILLLTAWNTIIHYIFTGSHPYVFYQQTDKNIAKIKKTVKNMLDKYWYIVMLFALFTLLT